MNGLNYILKQSNNCGVVTYGNQVSLYPLLVMPLKRLLHSILKVKRVNQHNKKRMTNFIIHLGIKIPGFLIIHAL